MPNDCVSRTKPPLRTGQYGTYAVSRAEKARLSSGRSFSGFSHIERDDDKQLSETEKVIVPW